MHARHPLEYYTRATYRHWFELGQPADEDPNLSGSLTEIRQDPVRVFETARYDRIAEVLAQEPAEERSLGIFGSPTFVVGEEVFELPHTRTRRPSCRDINYNATYT